MGFMTGIKGNKAYAAHAKGNLAEAKRLYEEAYQEGINVPKILLGYSVLLLRSEEYDKALEVLRRTEKAPGLTPDQRTQMLTNYAIVCWKQGRTQRAVEVMQELDRKKKNGTIYGTLGFLLIEAGDAEAALRYNEEAVDYDDVDPVFLDNLGQTYYRLLGDKEKAKPFFDKALKYKPTAIDTNYFLALYDIEAGDKEAAIEKLRKSASGKFSPLNYARPEMIRAKLAELGAKPDEDDD